MYNLFILLFVFFISCKNDLKSSDTVEIKEEDKVTIVDTISIKNTIKTEDNLTKIQRLFDENSLNHKVIETNKWIGKSAVFVFENEEIENDLKNVNGYVFLFNDNEEFKKIIIDIYRPEGNNAFIESFFFYNVDADKEKELIVLCSWKQKLREAAEGKLYQVFIYDNYIGGEKLTFLEEVSNNFGIEFDGVQEGEEIKAKFKDAKSIKGKLKELNRL